MGRGAYRGSDPALASSISPGLGRANTSPRRQERDHAKKRDHSKDGQDDPQGKLIVRDADPGPVWVEAQACIARPSSDRTPYPHAGVVELLQQRPPGTHLVSQGLPQEVGIL